MTYGALQFQLPNLMSDTKPTSFSSLTPHQVNTLIAVECGWTDINFYEDNAGPGFWNGYPPVTIGAGKDNEWIAVKAEHHKPLPSYFTDLNACAAMRATLTEEEEVMQYCECLNEACGAGSEIGKPSFVVYFATAPHHCEAFLRVKGKI